MLSFRVVTLAALFCFVGLNNAAVVPLNEGLQITYGQNVTPHSAPFVAYVQTERSNGKFFMCGGALISENYVLTAAHCMKDAKKVDVILGAHDLDNRDGKELFVSAARFTQVKDSEHHDIAVVQLSNPVKFTDAIKKAELPSRAEASETYEGQRGVVYGWGNTESGKPSSVLLKATMPVISRADCEKVYADIYDSTLCARKIANQGTCGGDSGGPLVVANVVVALVRGSKCGDGDLVSPSTFTRVNYYLDWIEKNTDVIIH